MLSVNSQFSFLFVNSIIIHIVYSNSTLAIENPKFRFIRKQLIVKTSYTLILPENSVIVHLYFDFLIAMKMAVQTGKFDISSYFAPSRLRDIRVDTEQLSVSTPII